MLPPDVLGNLGRVVEAELADRPLQLGAQFSAELSEFVRRGTLQSSMAGRSAINLVLHELAVRERLIYNAVVRTLDAHGVMPTKATRDDVLAEIRVRVHQEHDKLLDALAATPLFNASGLKVAAFAGEMATKRTQVLNKAEAELDLLIARAARPGAIAGATVSNTTVNIGVYQVGDHNTAHAVQNIDQSTRQSVTTALDEIERQLVMVPDAALSAPRADAHQMIELARGELAKEKPNRTLLASTLTGLAGVVGTVAQLQPAYEALKGALAHFGITLP